jgi:epoxyqueuosine reductase
MAEAADGSAARTRLLKQLAHDEGFDLCGIAAVGPLERDASALDRWLARGQQAEMHWMQRSAELRADPAKLLPGCRHVVVLALNYWPGADEAASGADAGKVALYARGRDYHKIFVRKLKSLVRRFDESTGASSRYFVDTGPMLERAWAERAGVGWIGKNANLITRDRGSWLLLSEILTTASLESDRGPHADFCGSCNACMEACPTDAIVEAGVVDSRRCISNWTIEHRGPIPQSMREGIGDWLFGCDICQDVCPWNRSFAQSVPAERFERREELGALDPLELVGMSEEIFRRRFSGTSLMRAKWEGMRRNACIVLGNRRDDRALPLLERALSDSDEVVAGHAAWALVRIAGGQIVPRLQEALHSEQRISVRREIRSALGGLGVDC